MNDQGRNHADTARDERVSALLSAAAAPSEPGPQPGEGAALAAYRASLTPTRRRSMISSLLSARTGLVAAVGAGVLLTGGVTTAAAGGLPGAAQDTASEMLAKVGIQVPGAAMASNGNADTRDTSDTALADEPADFPGDDAVATADTDGTAETDAAGGAASGSGEATGSGKGELISGIATETDAEGAEKGALISEVASRGKRQSGADHEDAGDDHGRSGEAPGHPEGAGSVSGSDSKSAQAKAGGDDADAGDSDEDASESSQNEKDDDGEDASGDRADGARR